MADRVFSPKITRNDLTGKTPSEIRAMAKEKGLIPHGDKNNAIYPRKFKDPVTNKERLRIDLGHVDDDGNSIDHPTASRDHVHGYDAEGNSIRTELGDRHFVLKSEQSTVWSVAFRAVRSSPIVAGLSLMFYSQNAY